MFDRPEIATIKSMAERLVDADTALRCPFIMPGVWQSVNKTEAVDFIARHIEMDRAKGNPPFLALYPPIRIDKLELIFGPVVLWQIVVDVDFDIGVVDLVDIEKGADFTNLDPTRRKRFLARVAAKDGPLETASSEPANDAGGDRNLSYLADNFPVFDRLENGLNIAKLQQAPNEVFAKISNSLRHIGTAEAAIEAVVFTLSMSRRRAGRLAIVYPDDLRAATSPGIELMDDDIIDCSPPTANPIDNGWEVTCNACLDAGLWQITSHVSAELLRITSITKKSDLPVRGSEAMIGPVRLFEFELPEKTRRYKTN